VPSHRAPSWTLANDPRSLIKRRQYNPLRYQSPHSKQERCGISDGPAVVLFVLFLLFVFLVIIIIVIVVIIVVLLLLLRPSLTCPNTLGLRKSYDCFAMAISSSAFVTVNLPVPHALEYALCGSCLALFGFASVRLLPKIPAPMIDRDVRDSTKFDRNFERVKFNSPLLARQPERISNRLEHSPLMVSSQNVIPLPNG
jgi:hypothetical protein